MARRDKRTRIRMAKAKVDALSPIASAATLRCSHSKLNHIALAGETLRVPNSIGRVGDYTGTRDSRVTKRITHGQHAIADLLPKTKAIRVEPAIAEAVNRGRDVAVDMARGLALSAQTGTQKRFAALKKFGIS